MTQFPKLHQIQWRILQKISKTKSSRFNDLKIKELDPKQFTYHLKKLVADGFVDYSKKDKKYLLSDQGKLLISYYENKPDLEQFPLDSYILLYIKKGDRILVVKRDLQPYFGYMGILSTYIQKKEFIEETAKKRLDSIGLKGDLSLSMIIEVLYKKRSEKVREHVCMYTFYVDNVSGDIGKDYDEGKLFWMKPQELLKVKKGYDNSKDLVEHFESKNFDGSILKMVSREYKTRW